MDGRVGSLSVQAAPPGTAAGLTGPFGALRISGTRLLMCGWARRLVVRPCPAAAHGHRSQAHRSFRRPPHQWRHVAVTSLARPRRRSPAPQPGPTARVSCSALACGMAEAMPNFARNSPATISNIEFRSLELQRFLTLLKLCSIELRATFLGAWPHRPRNFACNSLEHVSWFEV